MSGFVYIWLDRKHKRFYIGSHWGAEDDGYICSSSWMKRAYMRRPQDFKRRILSRIYTTHGDLLKEEHRWLNMIKDSEIGIRYYNLITKADHHWIGDPDRKLSVGKKISKAMKGRTFGPLPIQVKKKISKAKKEQYFQKIIDQKYLKTIRSV